MRVQDVMVTQVVTIPLGTSYGDVAATLFARRISGAPVVDAAGQLVGVVSERDLYRILYPWYDSFIRNPELYLDFEQREKKSADIVQHKVEVFMTKPAITTTPDTPIMRAGALMLAKRIHRLPVLQDGKLVGLVTRADLFRTAVKQEIGL